MFLFERKIQSHDVCFIVILILMFLGSMVPSFSLISLLLSVLIAFWLGNYYILHPSYRCMSWIVLLLLLQNFLLGVGAHITGNFSSTLSVITQIPFAVISIIWLVQFVLLRETYTTKERKYFYIYLVAILFSFVIGRGNLKAIVMNIRNMICFYMAYEIGKRNISTETDLIKYQRAIILFGIFMLICGIILLFGGYNLYKAIGIQEVYFVKKGIISNELDGRFKTILIKREVTRMGSLYYEPVNLGYFFAAAFIGAFTVNWAKKRSLRIAGILLMGIGLLLTFGKGAYLIVILTFLSLILVKIIKFVIRWMSGKTVRKVVLLSAIIAGVVFSVFYYIHVGGPASPHFWGVIQTWGNIVKKPYGDGLGTGGNMAQLFTNSGDAALDFSTGAESALMSFMYQYGIQGVFVLILCMKSLCVDNKSFLLTHKNYEAYYFLPILLLAISLLQDNTFTPQCIVSFMLLQGGIKSLSLTQPSHLENH